MVPLPVVRASNAALLKAHPFVAVFIGGTAGIGAYTVQALAATHGTSGRGLRAYIVGRNASAAEKIIADCLRVCPSGEFKFVKARDLSLMEDVDRVCQEIQRAEEEEVGKGRGGVAKVDLLVETQGYLSFEGRLDTKEGLDTVSSLCYYSRMRFILKLLPLLLASPLPATCVSVLCPGREGALYPDDLSLRHHYGYAAISHGAYMTTFFMEGLAKRYPEKLRLIHLYPGLVMTQGIETGKLPGWVKWIWTWFLRAAVTPFAVPNEECGERILFLASERFPARAADGRERRREIEGDRAGAGASDVALGTDGNVGSGCYAVTSNSEIVSTDKAYKQKREDGIGDLIWEHTMKCFEEIDAGRVWTG